MIVVDTNILIRYIVADEHDRQTSIATRFIEKTCSPSNPAIITSVVLAELAWTLDTRYRFSKSDILAAVDALLQSPNIAFDGEEEALTAFRAYREGGAGLADCMIAARADTLGAGPVVTFDKDAARLPGFRLLSAGV